MKHLYLLLVCLGVCLSQFGQAQCLILDTPLSERTSNSDVIIEGRVIAKTSFWDDAHTHIYTSNTVEVLKTFKGIPSVTVIEVITPGGIVESSMEKVQPSLQLFEGQVGIFMLDQSDVMAPGSSTPAERVLYAEYGPHGFIKYDPTDGSASDLFRQYSSVSSQLYPEMTQLAGTYTELVAFNPDPVSNTSKLPPSISSFSPTTVTAGTLTTLTINGSGFGSNSGSATVQFRDADDGGSSYLSANAGNIVSWSNTQIQVTVPSQSGTGTIRVRDSGGSSGTSSSSLNITYGQLTAYNSGAENRIDMADQNGNGGYSFYYTNSFNNTSGAVAAFERALDTWRCATFFSYEPIGTTSDKCHAKDGTNIVGWDGGCALGGNTIGLTNTYYDGCSTGGTWYWTLTEMDIRFANSTSWNYGPGATTGGKQDMQTIALHEIGHAHLLAHVIGTSELMHWERNTNTDVRTLSATTDIACGNEIVNRSNSNNACGPTKHIKLNSGNCSVSIDEVSQWNGTTTVAPNPFTASTFITVPAPLWRNSEGLSVTIFNVVGDKIAERSFSAETIQLDREGMAAGLYIYQINTGNVMVDSGKLIVGSE